jgi:hypothetical protein
MTSSGSVAGRALLAVGLMIGFYVLALTIVGGLLALAVAAEAYDAYWSQEIAPVLQVGFLPPIADGFRRFTSEERVTKAMAGSLEKGLQATKAAPYDTHPPLSERISALSGLPPGPDPSGQPPAISLLSDLPELERRWLAMVAGPSTTEPKSGTPRSSCPGWPPQPPRWRSSERDGPSNRPGERPSPHGETAPRFGRSRSSMGSSHGRSAKTPGVRRRNGWESAV